ncbi:hypothetical protein L6452_38499 [Arctium lappa]|uniref:Uncharacterized protein n=1 Tax=Arctium lappa TaxID=4217 RepID=A0ACB8XPQ3_ARCLA|nr:hypothetical protein L6452_38499 [Arctium lappa]
MASLEDVVNVEDVDVDVSTVHGAMGEESTLNPNNVHVPLLNPNSHEVGAPNLHGTSGDFRPTSNGLEKAMAIVVVMGSSSSSSLVYGEVILLQKHAKEVIGMQPPKQTSYASVLKTSDRGYGNGLKFFPLGEKSIARVELPVELTELTSSDPKAIKPMMVYKPVQKSADQAKEGIDSSKSVQKGDEVVSKGGEVDVLLWTVEKRLCEESIVKEPSAKVNQLVMEEGVLHGDSVKPKRGPPISTGSSFSSLMDMDEGRDKVDGDDGSATLNPISMENVDPIVSGENDTTNASSSC